MIGQDTRHGQIEPRAANEPVSFFIDGPQRATKWLEGWEPMVPLSVTRKSKERQTAVVVSAVRVLVLCTKYRMRRRGEDLQWRPDFIQQSYRWYS